MKRASIIVVLILLPLYARADKYEDVANQLHADILKMNWNCLVEVKDVDHNGIMDFYAKPLNVEPSESEVGSFLLYLASLVAQVTMQADWKSDKLYVNFKGEIVVYTTTANCRKCLKMGKEHPNDLEGLASCYRGLWIKVKE